MSQTTLDPHFSHGKGSEVFHDWLPLASPAHTSPVSLCTLVPHAPQALAATDTSKSGIEGFWLHLMDAPMFHLYMIQFLGMSVWRDDPLHTLTWIFLRCLTVLKRIETNQDELIK